MLNSNFLLLTAITPRYTCSITWNLTFLSLQPLCLHFIPISAWMPSRQHPLFPCLTNFPLSLPGQIPTLGPSNHLLLVQPSGLPGTTAAKSPTVSRCLISTVLQGPWPAGFPGHTLSYSPPGPPPSEKTNVFRWEAPPTAPIESTHLLPLGCFPSTLLKWNRPFPYPPNSPLAPKFPLG